MEEQAKTIGFALDTLFKFDIGDIVTHVAADDRIFKTDTEEGKRIFGFKGIEIRMCVTERLLQQCIGGVQKHYVLRSVANNGEVGKAFVQLGEHEMRLLKSVKEISDGRD